MSSHTHKYDSKFDWWDYCWMINTLLFLHGFSFFDWVSLCSPDWLWTSYLNYAASNSRYSASQVLGLHVYINIFSLTVFLLKKFSMKKFSKAENDSSRMSYYILPQLKVTIRYLEWILQSFIWCVCVCFCLSVYVLNPEIYY
jgi:hypothetical protein